MQTNFLMRGYDRRFFEWNLVYRYVRKGYLEGGGHGTLVDVSPNFLPLVEVFFYQKRVFFEIFEIYQPTQPQKARRATR